MDTVGAGTQAPARDTARAADAGILADIAADLASGRDLDALLQRFLDPIVRLAGAQAGAVRLLVDADDRLRLVSEIGLPDEVHACEEAVDRHCGVCGAAADGPAMVSSTDLGTCATRAGADYFGHACRRLLAVPLQHRGRVLGVYNLFFADASEPPPAVLALLKAIGELLGLALDNARLEAENLRARVMQERQAMAAEVHDSVAQTLTFAKMRLPLLEDALAAHDETRARQYLGDVRQALGDAHGSLREIITHFRKRVDARGLGPALDELAARFRRRAGIELSYLKRMGSLRMPNEVETDVFHIAQEALANIERHARARHAWLRVEQTSRGFEMRIEDDGIGPPAGDEQCEEGSHFGIGIMSERAHRLGGELSVTAREGGGTLVRLSCPLTAAGRLGAAR